jgi:hypothetical protein
MRFAASCLMTFLIFSSVFAVACRIESPLEHQKQKTLEPLSFQGFYYKVQHYQGFPGFSTLHYFEVFYKILQNTAKK